MGASGSSSAHVMRLCASVCTIDASHTFLWGIPSPAHKIGVMLAALSIILVSVSRGTLWEMRTAHGTPPNTTDDATLQRQLPLSAPRYQNLSSSSLQLFPTHRDLQGSDWFRNFQPLNEWHSRCFFYNASVLLTSARSHLGKMPLLYTRSHQFSRQVPTLNVRVRRYLPGIF